MKKPYVITQDNFFLLSANHIQEICKPLNNLGITHFTYMKNFADGSQVYFSNSSHWIENYYNLELYKSSSFENNFSNYQSGYFIWPKENNSQVFLHGRDCFDSDNGITVIHKHETYCEFYFFSGPVKATWLSEFYLNNIDLLEKFIIYFKDSAGCLLKKGEKNRILIYKSTESQSILLPDTCNKRTNFLREINRQTSTATPSSSLLSNRENEVALNVLSGQSAIQTAEKLFISRKTVERHIENMKAKLQCRNKAELIKKLLILNDANLIYR